MFKYFPIVACLLSCVALKAEVTDFMAPATTAGLKNIKNGPVTVAITKGGGAKTPAVDEDGMGYIEFYPQNEMAVTVADGYVINKITVGTTKYVFMQPVDVSTGTFDNKDFIWTPGEDQAVTTMTLTNGTEDSTGKNYTYTQLTAIKVEYDVPTAEQMTPEITDLNVSVLAGGSIQVTVTLPSAGYELYYKPTAASKADDDAHAGFTLATGSGKERTITLDGPATLTYYAYDPAKQTKGMQRTTTISDDGTTTGIASLTLNYPAASRSADMFDLQGRPVYAPARPGLYIQNGRKTLVK